MQNTGVSIMQNAGVSIMQNTGLSIMQNTGLSIMQNTGVSIMQNAEVSIMQDTGVSIMQNTMAVAVGMANKVEHNSSIISMLTAAPGQQRVGNNRLVKIKKGERGGETA